MVDDCTGGKKQQEEEPPKSVFESIQDILQGMNDFDKQPSEEKFGPTQGIPCPNCGYCPHCGRSSRRRRPYYDFTPWY